MLREACGNRATGASLCAFLRVPVFAPHGSPNPPQRRTVRQVTRAVAFYGDNVQVRRLMDQMDQMLDSLMPAKSAELPGGWTEDSVSAKTNCAGR